MNVILATQPPRRPVAEDTVWLAFSACAVHRGDYFVRLPPIKHRIVAAILAGCGSIVSTESIFECIYGDDPDGGPLVNTYAVHIHWARRALRPLGIRIINRHGRGYEAALLPMPAVEMQEAA